EKRPPFLACSSLLSIIAPQAVLFETARRGASHTPARCHRGRTGRACRRLSGMDPFLLGDCHGCVPPTLPTERLEIDGASARIRTGTAASCEHACQGCGLLARQWLPCRDARLDRRRVRAAPGLGAPARRPAPLLRHLGCAADDLKGA